MRAGGLAEDIYIRLRACMRICAFGASLAVATAAPPNSATAIAGRYADDVSRARSRVAPETFVSGEMRREDARMITHAGCSMLEWRGNCLKIKLKELITI